MFCIATIVVAAVVLLGCGTSPAIATLTNKEFAGTLEKGRSEAERSGIGETTCPVIPFPTQEELRLGLIYLGQAKGPMLLNPTRNPDLKLGSHVFYRDAASDMWHMEGANTVGEGNHGCTTRAWSLTESVEIGSSEEASRQQPYVSKIVVINDAEMRSGIIVTNEIDALHDIGRLVGRGPGYSVLHEESRGKFVAKRDLCKPPGANTRIVRRRCKTGTVAVFLQELVPGVPMDSDESFWKDENYNIIVELAKQEARKLHAVHWAHRDIHPKNVMVNKVPSPEKFEVALVDFGQAVLFKDRPAHEAERLIDTDIKHCETLSPYDNDDELEDDGNSGHYLTEELRFFGDPSDDKLTDSIDDVPKITGETNDEETEASGDEHHEDSTFNDDDFLGSRRFDDDDFHGLSFNSRRFDDDDLHGLSFNSRLDNDNDLYGLTFSARLGDDEFYGVSSGDENHRFDSDDEDDDEQINSGGGRFWSGRIDDDKSLDGDDEDDDEQINSGGGRFWSGRIDDDKSLDGDLESDDDLTDVRSRRIFNGQIDSFVRGKRTHNGEVSSDDEGDGENDDVAAFLNARIHSGGPTVNERRMHFS